MFTTPAPTIKERAMITTQTETVMTAVTASYLGATNTAGARIAVRSAYEKTVYDYNYAAQDAHWFAAETWAKETYGLDATAEWLAPCANGTIYLIRYPAGV